MITVDRLPRLLFLAARPARDTTAGQLLMHRHLLSLRNHFDVHVAHLDPPVGDERNYTMLTLSPFYQRLRHSRFGHWVEALDATIGIAVARRQLRRLFLRVRPDVVLTVAEPPLFLPVVAAARSQCIPIVTIVHDWSPVWLDLRERFRPWADRCFRQACARSTVTLSVSAELAAEFGDAGQHRFLPPIPGDSPSDSSLPAAPFHALYAGNFHYFQSEEISSLCQELLQRGRPDLLRVFGPEPDWSATALNSVRDGGFYAGFAKGPPLSAAFAAAGVLLVIAPFAEKWHSFARFSFPSKLTEYCGHHRPIILWGPEYSAAVNWARRSGAALVVTDRSAVAVVEALLDLERDQRLQSRIAAAAAYEAQNTFAPARLNADLLAALTDAMHPRTV